MPEQEIDFQSMIQKQRSDRTATLQQQFDSANAQIDSGVNDQITALNNQFNIQREAFRRRWKNTSAEQRQGLISQFDQMKTRFMGQAQAIQDKVAPTKRELETAFQSSVEKMTRNNERQDAQIQTIQLLTERGLLKPNVALQQQLDAMGIDVPLSQLPGTGPSPEQQRAVLEDDIKDIKNILKNFKAPHASILPFGLRDKGVRVVKDLKSGLLPVGSEHRKFRELDPGNPDDAKLIERYSELTSVLKTKEQQFGQLLAKSNPIIRSIVQKREKRQRAIRIVQGKSEKGGSLGASMMAKLERNPKTSTKALDVTKMSVEELNKLAGIE